MDSHGQHGDRHEICVRLIGRLDGWLDRYAWRFTAQQLSKVVKVKCELVGLDKGVAGSQDMQSWKKWCETLHTFIEKIRHCADDVWKLETTRIGIANTVPAN